MTDSDALSNGEDEQEWGFESGDIVREEHAKPSPVPGESEAPKQEYKIKRRLVDPTNGDHFYQVVKEEGGTHLYSDGVMRQYEEIDEEESRVWPKDDGGMF